MLFLSPPQTVDFETKRSYTLKVEGSNPLIDPQFLAWGPYKDEATIKVCMFIRLWMSTEVNSHICVHSCTFMTALEKEPVWFSMCVRESIIAATEKWCVRVSVDFSGGRRRAPCVCGSQLHFWGGGECGGRHTRGTSPRQGHRRHQQSCQVARAHSVHTHTTAVTRQWWANMNELQYYFPISNAYPQCVTASLCLCDA